MKRKSASDADYLRFAEILAEDESSIYFLWKCKENITVRINGELIPEGIDDPLEYLRSAGYIDTASIDSYDMFCQRVRERVDSGDGAKKLFADIRMKPVELSKARLFHIAVSFMDSGSGTDAVIAISRYTRKQTTERRILESFTSEDNPDIFADQVKHIIEISGEKQLAYIQFDVDRFKLINDSYGVERGDELLKYLLDSLGTVCGADFPYMRLTGDVFMVVITFDREEEIDEFVRLIERTIGNRFGEIEFRLTFGVAIAEDKNTHRRRMGDMAGMARKSVKGNAVRNLAYYNRSLKTALYEQSSIEDDMERAVENNEFVMYLQPKYSISTGKIIGAEALARWDHPKKGLVPPNEFIPIFEKNGFIVKLDQIIWELACKKIRSWLDNGIEPVPISVNISREYLATFDIVEKFTELIEKYDIPIKLFEAEITESVDTECTEAVVRRMKDKGFTMLMDDFGSGYSSPSMLKSTPFDVLKIDKEFLSEFMDTDRGRTIIAYTISMTHDLGLDVIAEGVESVAQAEFLSKCGCDTAQGFLYSMPVPEDEFDEKLKNER